MKPERWILGIGRAEDGDSTFLASDLITETQLIEYGGTCKIGKTYRYGQDSDEPLYTIMRIFDPYNGSEYVALFTAMQQLMTAVSVGDEHEFFPIIDGLICEGISAAEEFLLLEQAKKP